MSTYLYEKLQSDGYEKAKLKRWTKRMKLDIFALDQLLIPINIGNTHWVSASINFTEKRIEYYDSLPDHGYRLEVFKVGTLLRDATHIQNLRTYLQAEHREKKGSPLDLDDWEDFYSPVSLPAVNDLTRPENATSRQFSRLRCFYVSDARDSRAWTRSPI